MKIIQKRENFHNKRLHVLKIILAFLFTLAPSVSFSEVPLVFVSGPDPHFVDNFLKSPLDSVWLQKFNFYTDSMAKYHPAFTLITGDLGSQHWWDPKYQAICAPGRPLHDVILGCAFKSYGAFTSRMAKKGLSKLYVAVGDHEIGDNDWPLGARSESVPYFKEAFAKHFTTNPDGTSRFNGTLGGVPMRPIGTPYERTSYAVKAGNLLVVTIDEFQQQNPNLLVGRRGTVSVEVSYSDGHLQWLDNLLQAARRDLTIKFIIVQGHAPVLTPARACTSSSIYHEGLDGSDFWKVLIKHKVDFYFAGEVHRVTVDKPINPDAPIQVVNVGQSRYGFMVVRVYSKSIQFEYEQYTVDASRNKKFIPTSTLTVDKSQAIPKISYTGNILKPIDADGLQIYYNFDGNMSKEVINYGLFGNTYNAANTNIKQSVIGKLGSAAFFNGNLTTNLYAPCAVPTLGYKPRTFSAWVRMAKGPDRYLFPSSGFSGDTPNTLFRVFIDHNGKLGLHVDKTTKVLAAQGTLRLDDLSWHQVGVTFPGGINTPLSEMRFYIDGRPYLPATMLNEKIFTIATAIQIGGWSSYMKGWSGYLDDYAIWSSALSAPMMRSTFHCANALGYNAGDMESLLKLYRQKNVSATNIVKGRSWRYASGLRGRMGVCERGVSGSHSILLDISGHGVATVK